jgi:hypothetical protein
VFRNSGCSISAFRRAELLVQYMARAVILSIQKRKLDGLCKYRPSLNSSTSYSPTLKSRMSEPIHERGGDIPPEARERHTAPIPFTRNLNNDTINPVISEMRMDGGHIPGMVKESTVWDVYNNEARKVDNELVKDWTASLNFLLVFVSV